MSATKLREKVNSIADLRLLVNIPVGKVIETDSYYGDGNDGGNTFIKVVTGAQVDNGGTIIVGADGGVYESITPDIKNAEQFGAKGDGATDNTTIINDMLSTVVDYDNIVFPTGKVFNFSSQLTLSNVSYVTIKGGGTIQETVESDVSFLMTNFNYSNIEDLKFIGVETNALWDAGGSVYRQVFKSAFGIYNSVETKISDITVSKKRGSVHIQDAHRCKAIDIRNISFVTTGIADGNYYTSVRTSSGSNHIIKNIVSNNIGSLVLVGGDGDRMDISYCVGQDLYDNGVYISSGTNCIVTSCIIKNTGSGLKLRGSNHVASNNNVSDCVVGISITGNGFILDDFGANGSGTIVSNNIVEGSTSYGINVGSQDGGHMSDVVIKSNRITNNAGTVNFAPIYVTVLKGIKVIDNILYKFESDMGIFIVGVSAVTKLYDGDVSRNKVYDDSGKRDIYLSNVENSIISDNILSSGGTFSLYGREVSSCLLTGNMSDIGKIYLSTTYNSTGNIVIGNEMFLDVGISSSSVVEGNKDTLSTAVSITPFREGQIRNYLNDFYIAKGTSSASDWLRMTYEGESSNTDFVTALDISHTEGRSYNWDNGGSVAEVYTIAAIATNGYARCLVNKSGLAPTVTGATLRDGSPFVADTDIEMVVESPNGIVAYYYFLEI